MIGRCIDSGYRPAQFGVPIAANAIGCNPVAAYSSSNADFQFSTCNLTAADYIARVTVTDSNSQQAAMDVKIHVLASTYDDPTTRVLNLAAAFGSLQVTQFLSFFDQAAFSGYNSLEQNVRNTFPVLASMNINPRVSQANISCNDVTVRADWVQNYTILRIEVMNSGDIGMVDFRQGKSFLVKTPASRLVTQGSRR